jgi:hypothetical protein
MARSDKTSPRETSTRETSTRETSTRETSTDETPDAPKGQRPSRKACCLVSEMLQEMGLDSAKAKEIRRQALIGMMTFCQWQLARMGEEPGHTPHGEPRKARGRRVKVL